MKISYPFYHHFLYKSMKLQRHIRLDFTPLVDIALILVLAYMVILYHQKAKMIVFNQTKFTCGPVNTCHIGGKNQVELYLYKDHVLYVKGNEKTVEVYRSGYSLKEFREILKTDSYCVDFNQRIVLIKPTSTSIYGNLITTLNCFNQLGFKRFGLNPNLIENEETMLSQAEQMFAKSLVVSR